MRHRPLHATLCMALVVAGGCSSDDAGPTASTDATDLSAIAAVRAAGQDLYEACTTGDMAALHRMVDDAIADRPWEVACRSLHAHATGFSTTAGAVDGGDGLVHVRLRVGEDTIEEDWAYHHAGDGWHLIHVPPALMGGWDHDGHAWMPSEPTPTTWHDDHQHHDR